jgi:hypothetical protein
MELEEQTPKKTHVPRRYINIILLSIVIIALGRAYMTT